MNGPKAQTNTNSEVHLETGWDNMLSFKLDWGGGVLSIYLNLVKKTKKNNRGKIRCDM